MNSLLQTIQHHRREWRWCSVAVCSNQAKTGRAPKARQAIRKWGQWRLHALHAATEPHQQLPPGGWELPCLTLQPLNKRRSAKSLAHRSSELAAVLHLVRHDQSRHGLSADRASLFEMSRSNPSWVRRKSGSLSYSSH